MANTRTKSIRQIIDEMPRNLYSQIQGMSYYINHDLTNIYEINENNILENSDTIVFFKSEIIKGRRYTKYWEYDPRSKSLDPFSFDDADNDFTPRTSTHSSSQTVLAQPTFSWSSLLLKTGFYGSMGTFCGIVIAIILVAAISTLSLGTIIPLLAGAGALVGIIYGVNKSCNNTIAYNPSVSFNHNLQETTSENIVGSTHHVASKIQGVKKLASEHSSQQDLKTPSVLTSKSNNSMTPDKSQDFHLSDSQQIKPKYNV